jgi:Protein of unknown function (DUF3551)
VAGRKGVKERRCLAGMKILRFAETRSSMSIRFLLALLVAFLSYAIDNGPARAQVWCAEYDSFTQNCGFSTREQCLATVSGVGGICRLDPRTRTPDAIPPPGGRRDAPPEPTPSRPPISDMQRTLTPR